MAETSEESLNGIIRHSRTSSSTSTNSNEDCLVLSVAGLQQKPKRPNSGNNNTKSQGKLNILKQKNCQNTEFHTKVEDVFR